MKTKLVLSFFLIISNLLFAQNEAFIVVDKMPQYPKGIDAFHEFIINDISVPTEFNQSREDIRIRVDFVVEKDGFISNIKVDFKNFECQKCIEFIEKSYKKSEKWFAGEHNGRPLPIRFTSIIGYSPSKKAFFYDSNKPNLNHSDTYRVRVYAKPKLPK